MKSYLRFFGLVLVFVATGCGDGSSAKPAGSGGTVAGLGGGPGAGGAGDPDGSASAGIGNGGTLGTGAIPSGSGGSGGGSGGSGGDSKTGTGGSNGDAGPDKADTRVANADQAMSQGDALGSDRVCPVFEPCGGSVVGTWYLSSECRAGAAPSSCYGGSDVSFDRGATIAYTFDADGTFKASVSNPLRLIMRYPIVCLGSDAGAAQACSDYENRIRQSLPGLADAGTSTSTLLGFTCQAESDQVCLCSEDIGMAVATVTGNYSVSGNTIATTGLTITTMSDGGIGDAGAGELAEYCISGNTFRYRSTSGSSMVATMTR